ncbi:Uncharacterised protein [Mycolicibacterium aurum]|uniref:Uncharacterized protein n=1 Tax=Mycolicibacterium aurum TaxID=1791 RepID=A0A3S4VW05_MYCAU|nr:hypothetical protein [Mycolicibacterium aurum]VEG51472.1 Uncharacterised protein [Mycolicibacterium aurum]VEG56701.1 Uncharacterised protein [Mycolicibacterium aurum]VEG58355.1 Uncharacterised protein [Mycolicibacterium aurum]
MKNLTITATAAAALTAGFLGLAAPALAAPTGNGDARATISQLEAQGNRVIVNKLSDASLSEADVVSVKQGGPIRGTVQDDFNDRTYQQTVTGYVYYVDVR